MVGSALAVKYDYAKDGKPILIKEPKLMLNDNDAGKPEGIHLMIGRRPNASFGNSTGDQQMLEYTGPATAHACRCWCCTTTQRENMLMARRKACRTPRSAPSPQKQRRRTGR